MLTYNENLYAHIVQPNAYQREQREVWKDKKKRYRLRKKWAFIVNRYGDNQVTREIMRDIVFGNIRVGRNLSTHEDIYREVQ